jgi:hypothetical protein
VDASATAAVEVRDFEFAPATATVAAGGKVTWKLVGEAPHSITAGDGSFDSGILDPGASFSQTFDEPGTYAYSCLVHPNMKGTVQVVAASAATSGAASADATGGGSSGGGGLTMPPLVWGSVGGAAILAATALLLFAARRIVAAG